MQLSFLHKQPSLAPVWLCLAGVQDWEAASATAISYVSEKYNIESMINFSISLCGYRIIVPIDSQGPLLNINMHKEKLESKRWYFRLNNVKYL